MGPNFDFVSLLSELSESSGATAGWADYGQIADALFMPEQASSTLVFYKLVLIVVCA
jgi:hypothetical protein